MITVLGSLNIDLVLTVPRLPRAGETLTGDRLRTFPGGKGANQAVAAARLGGQVSMVGRVGSDAFGESLIGNLEANGVDASGVERDHGEATGTAMILVEEGGQNMIAVAPGANATVGYADVERALARLHPRDVLVLQLEIGLDAVRSAIERGRAAQAQILLNAAPARRMPESLLRQVDVLVVNEGEASVVSGQEGEGDGRAAARVLRASGLKTVVVTLGPQGALVCDVDGVSQVHAFQVDAVDTTGAGDTFVGAMSVALAAGLAIEPATRFANAAGAAATTGLGAQAASPRQSDLRRLFDIDLASITGGVGRR